MSLPLLRKDIKVYRGPNEFDGGPTFNLYDPLTETFFKISWKEAKILEYLKPDMTLIDLTTAINQDTTLKVSENEIRDFFVEASNHNLLDIPFKSEKIISDLESKKQNIFVSISRQYFSFTFVLGDPNQFLTKTLPFVKLLFSPLMILLFIIITSFGITQILIHFDEYLAGFKEVFNYLGMVALVCVMVALKVIHELAHAYLAKNYKLNIHAVIFALVFFWPLIFIDITDAWKLKKRKQRVFLSLAGVGMEFVIAGISSFFWVITEPGPLKSIFFILSSVSLIKSIMINLNPAFRLDGYYFLSDLLSIDNLQPRAFNLLRTLVHKYLFSLEVENPEKELSTPYQISLFIYAIYTIFFRIGLYLAIATFVYYQMPKTFGIFAFTAAAMTFVITPTIDELRLVYRKRGLFKMSTRFIFITVILAMALGWLIIPFPHTNSFPATTIPIKEQVIYVPYPGKIAIINVKPHQDVKEGQALITLVSSPLEAEIASKIAEKERVISEIRHLSRTPEDQVYLPEKQTELQSLESALKGLQDQKDRLTITAKISGTLYEWDEALSVNQYVARDQILGKIAPFGEMSLVFFVPEKNVRDIAVGQKVKFTPDSDLSIKIEGIVKRISPIRQEELPYPELASINEGALPVIQGPNGQLDLTESYYPIFVELSHQDALKLKIGQKGKVKARGPWKSLLLEYLRGLGALLWRESGS